MKTLYISDLDGTLLQNDSKISAKSCEIINNLINRGVSFSYATARGIYTALNVTTGLHCKLPVITKNGVIIARPDTCEVITKNIFSKEETKDIYQILCEAGISPVIYSYQNGKEKFSYNIKNINSNINAEGFKWYISEHKNDERKNPLSDNKDILSGEVFYFSCIGTRDELEDTYQIVQNKYQCIFSKDTYNDYMWLEIMPKAATKANACLQLKEMLDFDYIVAFGDGINDIPMFEIADECYAVQNAVSELKEMATGIIGTNLSDGVAVWLKNNFNL